MTSREFQTINIQGAGVGEVLLEGGGQGDEGECRGSGGGRWLYMIHSSRVYHNFINVKNVKYEFFPIRRAFHIFDISNFSRHWPFLSQRR